MRLTITHDYLILFQVYRSRKYLNSKLPVVSPDVTTVRASEHSHSVEMKQSERPATLNNNSQTAGWYSSDVAPSTLLFLAGPKDCVEDSIPEISMLWCNYPFKRNLP